MKNTFARNQIINYGIITSFFGVSFSFMQFYLGNYYENNKISLIISLLILYSGIVFCGFKFKKKLNGIIDLNTVLKLGTGISCIYAITGIIFYLLLVNFFEPSFWDTSWKILYDATISENPEQMTNTQTGKLWTFEEFREWTQKLTIAFIICIYLFCGFMFSLLLGIIIQKSEY
tara:strand:- start:635 stop:1156 length:522 start_codon:yes stop_codon:yes gene_type:complete